MKNRITLLNTITTLLLQIVTIISGFLIPKIIIDAFGSEVNGLVSSIGQFLSYISLVEGGITGVIMASLYRPLIMHDNKKISAIIASARKFYAKIAIIFIVYAIILAFVYPLIINNTFNYFAVLSLVLISSISLMIQYLFTITQKTLLNADKKIYIISITQILIHILTIAVSIISVKIYPSIHLLKFLTGILFIIQPIVYYSAIKKYYKIDKNISADKKLLKSRWDGFAINVAAFIHNSTDIAILSIFTNLSTVSVYSVYALVTTGLKNLINSTVSSLNPTLGHAYAKNNSKELNQKMDLYEYIIFMLVFFSFTVAALLIVPFVMIYTKTVNDANYYQPLFAILLIVSEAIYLLKYPHLNLAYSTNKFKEISPSGFIEAAINIVISIILVSKFGLIGVSIGTIIAMTYRMIYHVKFTTTIVERRQSIFYKKLLIFIVADSIGILISKLVIHDSNYIITDWILHLIVYSVIIGATLYLTSIIFFKKEYEAIKNYIFKGKGKSIKKNAKEN